MNRDQWFMNLVYLIAMKSKDEKTKIGAIIVRPDNTIVSTGYNGFPMGINDDVPERQERPTKYFFFNHAEVNSIIFSKQDVRGCKMYTNGIPCSGCARCIIQAGITEVYYDAKWFVDSHKKWEEEAVMTKQMFEEAGIELIPLDFELVKIVKVINGKVID